MSKSDLATVILSVLTLTVGGPATAGASNYRCSESSRDTALLQRRLQYGVVIESLGRVTDPRITHGYDSVEKVKVSVLSRDPRKGGAFALDRPEFSTLAKTEDVLYVIDSWKANGLSLTLYLDELDQSSLALRGVQGHIQLRCR